MANYTVKDIQALRERTGAGMMDVKKALDEADGDVEKALELIRVKGLQGASKREGGAAVEGLITAAVKDDVGVMIEINCETDFVDKYDKFIELGSSVIEVAVYYDEANVEEH